MLLFQTLVQAGLEPNGHNTDNIIIIIDVTCATMIFLVHNLLNSSCVCVQRLAIINIKLHVCIQQLSTIVQFTQFDYSMALVYTHYCIICKSMNIC